MGKNNYLKKKIRNIFINSIFFRFIEMSWQKTNFKFKDSSFWLKILVPLFLLYYFLYELIHKNQLRFSGLDIPITTRCNLYCDNCANLMNYYKGESINLHLSLDELIEEFPLELGS